MGVESGAHLLGREDDHTDETIHVLHVDDDEAFLDLASVYLGRLNESFEVITETEVTEALDSLSGQSVDCIVSDYDMPETTGLEFLDDVRETYPQIPFILFTGKGSEEIASRAISAGVTDYLQKQTGTEQYAVLGHRIENAVSQYRARRRAERERARFEALTENANDVIITIDDESTIQFVNPAVEQTLGYAPDDFEGQPLTTIMPERLRERHRNSVQRYLETGERGIDWGNIELPGQHADGHEVPLSISFSEFEEDDEHFFTGILRDVSERKEREQELELKDRAMDEAPIGILITDADRPDNPIIYANEQFQQLTGYDESEVLGRNCRFLQGEETDPSPVSEMREAIDAEEPVSVVLLNYRQDGSPFWNRVTIAPVHDETGSVSHFVGFQQDVTDHKESERRVRTQLQQFDEFGSVLSHDLQTPLSVLEGRLELASETGDTEHIERAESALDRVKTLVDDLANVMRERSLVTDIEVVDLKPVVRETWESLRTDETTLVVEDTGRIRADEMALRRMFENLLHNAIEHAGRDVTVTVGMLDDGFYVEDDGPGIPETDRESVFDPGFTTKEDGNGVGLMSVRQIALAHGWDIVATEGTEGGARFEITDVQVV